MRCPNCNVALTMADRQGVEVDYCPQCHGVWLDRGELEKIIKLSATAVSRPRQNHPDERAQYEDWDDGHNRVGPGSELGPPHGK